VATERRRRLLAALCALALVPLLLAAGGSDAAASGRSAHGGLLARSFEGSSSTATLEGSALAALSWRGGPIVTSTGETVTVLVSDTYPLEAVAPESWAEFLTALVHGPELSLLTTYVAPLDEVQQICGGRALGCYSANRIVATGDTFVDGTTPEEVLRHEYGHHVAFHRVNTPWQAIDWGPKNWASAANVCLRVSRQEAFPGDEGSRYELNPGEAWAEVYRLLNEHRAGITTGSWGIVAPSFYPDEAALQAAERDVLQPWTAGQTTIAKRIYGKKTRKVWLIALRTPLDGDLTVSALLPRNGLHDVALVGPDRTTVVKRAQWVGQRLKKMVTTVCGQRSLYVRVTQKGALGPVKVVASTP
jgi:hypothetical protein